MVSRQVSGGKHPILMAPDLQVLFFAWPFDPRLALGQASAGADFIKRY